MSFILDALRKSEHERQRSAVPGLAQIPVAAAAPQVPRWAFAVIGVLVAAVLALGGAWWQTARVPAELATAPPPTVERSVALPAAPAAATPAEPALPRPLAEDRRATASEASLASAAADAASASPGLRSDPAGTAPAVAPRPLDLPADGPPLPSAAALAAEGVAVPSLRLELHAYSAQRSDRFVFINGRKYAEGERLIEGPQLVAIEPTGAVLAHAGRRFLLVQE